MVDHLRWFLDPWPAWYPWHRHHWASCFRFVPHSLNRLHRNLTNFLKFFFQFFFQIFFSKFFKNFSEIFFYEDLPSESESSSSSILASLSSSSPPFAMNWAAMESVDRCIHLNIHILRCWWQIFQTNSVVVVQRTVVDALFTYWKWISLIFNFRFSLRFIFSIHTKCFRSDLWSHGSRTNTYTIRIFLDVFVLTLYDWVQVKYNVLVLTLIREFLGPSPSAISALRCGFFPENALGDGPAFCSFLNHW